MDKRKFSLIFLMVIFLTVHFPCPASAGQGRATPQDPNTHIDRPAGADARTLFTTGYKLFEKKDYWAAAPYFYHFLNTYSPDVTDYEWAEFFFGICLKKCGFSHAAVDVLSHLIIRKPNPKIVSYCLELFEQITRTIPFDQDLIILKVICDQEYGFVEKKLTDFINYHQGVFDWKHGFFQWGNDHFNQITPDTYYFYKFLYQKAFYRIYQDQIDDAMAVLRRILKSSCRAEDLKDEVRMTLARLLYERGQFEEAEMMYQKIRKPVLEQARDLLERAWVHYRMGNREKAMGLLYAFEAPSFQEYFTPEYYILKSFIYKDVCHYQKAMSVVKEFNAHYGESLKAIYDRKKPLDNPALLLVILSKKTIHQTWQFLRLLDEEKVNGQSFQDESLKTHLEVLYTLKMQETVDNLRKQIEEEYETMANELLKYEEEAYLMEYEIGLDMYQRVYQYHYGEEKAEGKKDTRKKVIYPFQGEFWNDELKNYKVILPDKCNCLEEWDIFFK